LPRASARCFEHSIHPGRTAALAAQPSEADHVPTHAPPNATGLNIIVDDSIEAQPEIYMEAGDHETLLHLSHAQFARLTANALHGRFSAHD